MTTYMKCYHCEENEAERANGTFCNRCCEDSSAWDPNDTDLLERLGRAEVRAWRSAAWEHGDYATVDTLDASGLTGTSRWETIAQRAEREGVSSATIRRAIDRGLGHRRLGRRLEVDRTEPLPAVEKSGPKPTRGASPRVKVWAEVTDKNGKTVTVDAAAYPGPLGVEGYTGGPVGQKEAQEAVRLAAESIYGLLG